MKKYYLLAIEHFCAKSMYDIADYYYKNENNFAIELLFTEKYTYITIQTPTENEVGEFDHRQFVCKKIED
jgi:hypothetical protein